MERRIGYSRLEKEEEALRRIRLADNAARRVSGCDTHSLWAVVSAARNVAQARVFLTSIGFHESDRTRNLWRAVGLADKRADAAIERVERCFRR
jgi:hypothetical protein